MRNENDRQGQAEKKESKRLKRIEEFHGGHLDTLRRIKPGCILAEGTKPSRDLTALCAGTAGGTHAILVPEISLVFQTQSSQMKFVNPSSEIVRAAGTVSATFRDSA